MTVCALVCLCDEAESCGNKQWKHDFGAVKRGVRLEWILAEKRLDTTVKRCNMAMVLCVSGVRHD